MRLCSSTSGGIEENGNSRISAGPAISADGQYLAIQINATNLSTDANTGRLNILRKDVSTGAVACCSVSGDGVKADGAS